MSLPLIHFKINIPKVEYFQKKQQRPTMYVYIVSKRSTFAPCKYVLDWGHFNKTYEYKCIDGVLPRILDDETLIAFDFYVETQNQNGVWCRMHRGLGNMFLKQSFTSMKKGTRKIRTRLVNVWAHTVLGNIEVDFTELLEKHEFSFRNERKMFFEDSSEEKRITERMIELVRSEMGLFGEGSYTLRSTNKFLKRVHAPLFNGRVSPMPGFAYVMNATELPASDAWFHRYYSHALERLGLTDEFVQRKIHEQYKNKDQKLIVEGFHDCCLLLTTMVSLTAACYPYESDFFVDSGRKKPFESFDNIFIRRAGDCEDFARGMHFVLSSFQNRSFDKNKWGGMASLNRLSKLYLSGIILAEVSTPQHGGVVNIFKSRQAHMYTQIFPIKYFIDNVKIKHEKFKDYKKFEEIKASFDHRPWMTLLRVYVIEGTAPVQPFTSLKHMNDDLNDMRREFEVRSLKQLNRAMPGGLAREFRPAWSVMQDDFYKNCAHIYTDYFINKGANVGSFAFWDDKKGSYGVDLQQVLSTEGFSFIPHQFFTDEDVTLIKFLLTFESPFPELTWSRSSMSKMLVGKQQAVIDHFITRMRAANAGKEAVAGTTDLYNDFFLQSPHQLSHDQFDRIFDFLSQRTVRQEIVLEGFDKESAILRIRAFGIK